MARTRRREPTRGGAVSSVVTALVILGLAAYLLMLAGERHGEVVRSDRVQAHGPRVTATVRSVRIVKHRERYGSTYVSLLTVDLARSVEGRRSTTVHVSGRSQRQSGDRVTVALDPDDASYAELVGKPARTAFAWIGALVVGIVLLIFGGLMSWAAWRSIQRYRAARS